MARVRGLVSSFPSVCAVTAVRVHFNPWATSHSFHDREREACYWGCGAPDRLVHYLFYIPMRASAGMLNDEYLPRECTDVAGAIRRGVIACAAHRAMRARRRDEGVPSVAEV